MAFENTSGLPYTGNLPFKGAALINGEPVNRSNAGYKTLGGFVDDSNANNAGLTAYFGLVVSTDPTGSSGAFVLGQPSGYIYRGVLMADNSVLQNEPAKSGYMLQGVPATVIYEGTATYQYWTKTQVGAIDPVLGAEIIFRALSTGTGAAPIGAIEFLPSGTAIPTGWAAFPGYVVQVGTDGVKLEFSFSPALDVSIVTGEIAAYFALAGQPFRKTVTLTSAAAGTAVHILTDANVGAGRKVYINQMLLDVAGATAWTDATATIVKVQDTSAVVGGTYAKAQLTGNAFFDLTTTGLTLAAPIKDGTGFTTAKGIDIIADANFAAGSDIKLTVTGYIA